MKKIILAFIATLAIFSSCSSDDNLNSSTNETKSYKVTFDIENYAPQINVNPLLKSSEEDIPDNLKGLDMAIYDKNTGNIVLKTADLRNNISVVEQGKSFKMSLILPEGDYYVSIAYYHEAFTWDMNNYFTDKIVNTHPGVPIGGSGTNGRNDNFGLFFNSIEVSTPAATNQNYSIVLKPVFSLIELNVDASELVNPEGTSYITCSFEPTFANFNIKEKQALDQPIVSEYLNSELKLDNDKKGTLHFVASETKNEDNNMKLVFKFMDIQNNVLETKTYDLNTKLQNNNNYKIKGKLTRNTSTSSLALTVKQFDNENPIVIDPTYE